MVKCLALASVVRVWAQHEAKFIARFLCCLDTLFVKQCFGNSTPQGLSVSCGSKNNRLREKEMVEWMVCHSDRKYLHQIQLPAIMNLRSLSDENSSPKKSGCTVLASLRVFEIVFIASNVLYNQCCSTLTCIATPMSYCNLRCVPGMFYLVRVSVKR